jgi:hypothetical protein
MFRGQLIHAIAKIATIALAMTMLLQVCCLASARPANYLTISTSAGEPSDCHDETPDVPQSPATPDHHCCVHKQPIAAPVAAHNLPQLDVRVYRSDIATVPLAAASTPPVGSSVSSSPPGLTVLRI